MADPIDAGTIAVAVVPSLRDFAERMRAALLPEADRLGREAGDRIKAGVDAKLRDIRLGVSADTAKANAELDKTKAKADEIGRKDETVNVRVADHGSLGWMTSAVAAATAIAPAFAVAGVGIAAFTTLAVPSLKAVAEYESEVATGSAKAADTWEKMTTTQRAMAAGVTSLTGEFHQLSNEIDPQVLQVFEAAIGDVDRVLPEAVPLAKAAAGAIVQMLDAIGGALTDSQAKEFFDFVAKSIGPDVQQIDTTVVALLHTLFNLIEALQPTSLALLHVVSGFAMLLSWVSRVAPPLDSIVVLAIALYRPLMLLKGLNLASAFGWIGPAVQGIKDFTVATEGATLAEKAQLATTVALEALEPWMWAALAIGGLAALAFAVHQNSDATDQLIAKMREQDQATGYNIAGYQKLSAQLDKLAAQRRSIAQEAASSPGMADPHMAIGLRNAAGAAAQAEDKLTEASRQAAEAAYNLNNNLSIVQMTFGLARKQAEELASKAGVTAKELTGNGSAAQEAMRKILAYGNGMDAASQTTNALTLAISSLTTAMKENVESVLTLEGDEVSWRQAQQAATQAVNQNKNALDGNSKSALNARQAIISATDAVVKFATDQMNMHHNLEGASVAIQDQIRWLEKHAGKSKIAAQEIKALRHEEGLIKAQIRSQILISGKGTWATVGTGPFAGKPTDMPGGAAGMYITRGTTPTADDVLIRASKGELVVPEHLVSAGAVDHLRGKIPGFAQGGVVPSYSGAVNGETNWLAGDLNSTYSAMANSLAHSLLGGVPGAGGGYNASYSAEYAFAKSLFHAHGWGLSQWPYLFQLWQRESGWNPRAQNPSSGAAGIPQDITGNFHGGYQGQIVWGEDYIAGRYGSPAGAWAHEVSAGWYDRGGYAPPGASILLNGTGRPEPVLTDAQLSALTSAAAGGDGASVTEYHAHFDGATTAAIQSQVRSAFSAMDMQQAMLQRPARRR